MSAFLPALYKAFARRSPAFFALALLTLSTPAAAQAPVTDEPYTIEGVSVDVTAGNAVKAREQALSEAQVKAFEQLAAQSMSEEEFAAYSMPDPDTVMALV